MLKYLKECYKQAVANHANEGGMSTIQIAIGIMITVIMLLGAIGGYQYVNQSKASNEVQMVSDLKAATVKYGNSVGAFNTSNTTLAILGNMGFFGNSTLTPNAANSPTTVTNQWGGTLTVAPGTLVSAGDSIVYTQTGMPQNACLDVGTKLDNMVNVLNVGTTNVKSNNNATTVSALSTACTSGANSLVFTISK